jgi:LacI family transcriptional regulator
MGEEIPHKPLAGRVATLQSIAEAVGVHRSTVARALDPEQSHRISSDVVARIQAEVRRQGYRRDAVASSLRTGRSRLVGVVVPDLANPVFAPILDGIGATLSSRGYSMLVADSGEADEAQIDIIEELIARRVDGLVLATAKRNDYAVPVCLQAAIPTVLVNRGEDTMRASTVVSNDELAIDLSVKHLLALGHRRIGHLAGPENLSTGILRRRGFEAAMRAADLQSQAVAVANAYNRQAGQAATAELLDRWPDLTAIAASNDLVALGAYQEFKRRGLVCPTDISIVGHNDMPLVDMLAPPMTTIRIGHNEMGATAASILLEHIAAPSRPASTALIPPKLILRDSTGRPCH